MKKLFSIFLLFVLLLLSTFNFSKAERLFASPEQTLFESNFAEELLIKLQNKGYDDEIDKMYKYLEILCHENTQFYSYKLDELEMLMDGYRDYILKNARTLAENENYKQAVEYLESKSEIFKDKTTINTLINHYSKFFIKDGLFYCDISPRVIAINKLIAYPTLAFNNSNFDNYEKYYLTNKEFSNLLQELHLNDYILIDINDYLDFDGEKLMKKDLYLPLNKKPLILLFNNINYNSNEEAFIEKFIIDQKDKISCFNSKQTEKNQISQNTDFIPILENFIDNNTEFSHFGAKAVISFERNGAILGYDINKSNPNYNQDILNLKKLVALLKTNGYEFAYSFDYSKINNIEEEVNILQNEIFGIFSNLKLCFTNSKENKIMPYYYELNKIGFKGFFNTSGNTITIKNNLAIIGSLEINGGFLRENSSNLQLNYEKIYDHSNRSKVFKI